jgi:hypothetical protein
MALCRSEYARLGADAFKQMYGTPQACIGEMAAKAAAIVKNARAQCASADNKPSCVRAAITEALRG